MATGSIKFVADASQLTAASAEARQSVASVAATAEQARQKIVASYQAQVVAAKEAGASQRQLESISTQAANKLASVTEDSAKRYINAIDRMEDRTRKFNAARSSLAASIPQAPVSQFTFGGYSGAAKEAKELSSAIEGVGKSAEYSVAPSVRFGSVIRSMEGGFSRNIRSAEYFGASLKFLAPLMEAAFPVVGAITLGWALVQMGKHAYDAFENIVLLRDAIKGLNQLQINVDTTVTKNQDAAEASVEAILSSTQGKTAADKQKYAYAQNTPLDNASYFYSKEFSGLDSNIKANYETKYKSIAPNDIPAALASIKTEIYDLKEAQASIKDQGGLVTNVGGYGPGLKQDPSTYYKARILAASQIQSVLQSGSDARSASLQADQTAIPHDQTEEAKKRAQEAKSARQQALAAQQQASARAIAAQNDDYLEWQAVQNRSKLDEMLYWSSLVALRNDGSARALDATKKYNQANVALNRENAEAMKTAISGFTGEYLKDFYASSGLSSSDVKSLNKSGGNASDYIASLRESIDLKKQDSDAIAENAIQMAVATGQMTKLDAARATAALHQQQYSDSLKELNDQRAAISSDPTISSLERSAQLQDNANQRNSLSDNYGIQQQRDQQALNSRFSNPGIGSVDALDDFVNASKDAAGAMREVVTNTLRGLNQSIVNGLTGGKTNFGQVAAKAGRGVLGAGLNAAEGSVLGALGFGKMGSKSNPIYTINAGSGTGSSTASALSSLIPSSKGSGVAGFFGGLVKTVLPFLATGGDFSDGAVVGEAGPEIITGSGHVTSNRNLRSMLNDGGGTSISYSIDARGTDPVLVQQRVQTAIVASHQSSLTQAVKQVNQQNVRRPARR